VHILDEEVLRRTTRLGRGNIQNQYLISALGYNLSIVPFTLFGTGRQNARAAKRVLCALMKLPPIGRSPKISLLWDGFRNRYYRVVAHSQPARNSSGRPNEFNDCPWSIIVLDADFRILGEQKFLSGKYRSASAFPTRKGLLVANKSVTPSGLPDRRIHSFTLFSISE